jgi:hypothetical protein
MLRDKGLILLLLFVPAMLLVPFVHADDMPASHVRMVRVTSVSGQAQIAHQQGGGYQSVTMNAPIIQGDIVRTGDDGWVEIQLENGSRIRLAPDSEMTFSLLSRFASGATASEVSLDSGEAAFAVVAGDDIGPLRLNVHQRVISLKRSSRFRVTTIPSDPLEVVVWKGEVGIFDREASQEVSVQSQETFTLDPQDVGHYDLEKEAQVDELDDWANQRDQALMAYADTQTGAIQAPPVAPLSYGPTSVASLQPYDMGFGWDPFMFGYWGSPYAFGGMPWLWPGGFFNPVILVPPIVVRPPIGSHPPHPRAPVPPAVRAAANNPALTVSSDHTNRLVISNERTPVQPLNIVDTGNNQQGSVGTTGQRVVHTHPPVEIRPVTPRQPNAVNAAQGPQGHAQPRPQAPRPQMSSAPPRSFSAPSAPAMHGGGGGRH